MADDKQKSRTSIPMIVTGLVMILLFVGLAGFLVLQRASIPTVDEQTAQVRLKNLADLNAENQRILTQYHWVDKSKGVVGIPINRAMDLVLAELQANKPHAAGPVNPPAAPPPATPAPSPNNQRPGGGQ
ncbi:MAG: hypothetical protein JO251_16845 [Verrucomicrobia bacterium]|jgi:hypothetical protein|nr:hypothetical protein [Verrucomicrobiota bacterium]MBV8640899.1 hypothetical protein [Verrucomicrobiota bacterium]